MSTESNKAVVRRFYEELLNQGRLEVAEEVLAEDFADQPAARDRPGGPEGFRQFVALVGSTFPDIHVTIEDLIAEGDKVAARLTVRGTQQGPFRGFPATGKPVTWSGIDLIELAAGKIVRRWSERDFFGMLEALGLLRRE